jgi:hypothetical protein
MILTGPKHFKIYLPTMGDVYEELLLHFHPSAFLHYERAQMNEIEKQILPSEPNLTLHSENLCDSKKLYCLSYQTAGDELLAKHERCLEWLKATREFIPEDQNLSDERTRHDSVGSVRLRSLTCCCTNSISWSSVHQNEERTFFESWTSTHTHQGPAYQMHSLHMPSLST